MTDLFIPIVYSTELSELSLFIPLFTTDWYLGYGILRILHSFFTSSQSCLRHSIVSGKKPSSMKMFVFFSLFAFFRTSFFSLKESRLHTIVLGFVLLSLLPLLIRCARSIWILSKPSFSWNTSSTFSSHFSYISYFDSEVPYILKLFLLDLSYKSTNLS